MAEALGFKRRLVIGAIAALMLTSASTSGLSSDLASSAVNLPAAMEATVAAAKRGDAQAAFVIAETFARGVAIAQNFSAAIHWYQIAADKDHAGALNALGQLYAEGLGVDASIQTAIDYLTRAATLTNSGAFHFDLAQAYESADPFVADAGQKAIDHYRTAIDLGHVPAAANLGQLYLSGEITEPDFSRAYTLLSSAANAGDARALNNLGLMYVHGSGVERDNQRAAQLFDAAASQGLPVALRNLGEMYANGFGVSQDEKKAHELYRLSARTVGAGVLSLVEYQPFFIDPRLTVLQQLQHADLFDHRFALAAGDPIAVYAEAMRLIVQNDASAMREGFKLMQMAADTGLSVAQANLGLLYLQGRGAPQDYAFGYLWLNKSVSSGLIAASDLRNQLAKRLTRQELEDARALSQLR